MTTMLFMLQWVYHRWLDPLHPLSPIQHVAVQFAGAGFTRQRWTSSIIKMHLVKPSTVKNSLAVPLLTWRMGSAAVCCRMLCCVIGVCRCYIMYCEQRCNPYPDVNAGMSGKCYENRRSKGITAQNSCMIGHA